MMKLKNLSASLVAASLLTLATPLTLTHAANHPLSMTSNTVNENGVEFVDLTVNVDWDFEASVPHFNNQNNPQPITLNKPYIRDQIAQVARSLFVMTDGKQKLRNVYVFNKKQYGENVDVQLINKEGRAYASGFSGFGYEGFSTYNFLGMNTAAANAPANVVNENFLGQVVAHELGHYFLGLADEYVEADKALDPANPGSPAGTDTALNTLMNNHETFARLSTAADYGVDTQTAQGRVYRLNSNNQGASAWETLIRNPALDSDVAKGDAGHNGRRIWFAAFKNLSVPSIANMRTSTLSNNDTLGYDSDTRIIFKDGAAQEVWSTTGNNPVTNSQPRQRKVIVIDRTLPESAFNEAIATAKAILAREAAVTDVNKQARYGVVALPATSGPAPTLSEDAAGINDRIAGLSSITRASSSSFDVSVAFNFVRQNLLPTPDAQSATTDSLELLTRQGATAPADLGAQAKANKVALNIVGFRLPASTTVVAPAANTVPLATLAQQTGGDFNTAKNAQEATREMAKAAAAQAGQVLNLIDADSHPALPSSGSQALTRFYLAPAAYDGSTVVLTWYFDPADANRLSFFIRQGSSNANLIQEGPNLVVDGTNGIATYRMPNTTAAGQVVEYTMGVSSTNGATADGIDMEVASDASTASNPISLGASVVGGATDSLTAPVITARFGGSTPIKGGEVTVSIVRASDGTTVLEGLSMQDNGAGADERANDGVYTLSLDGRLPAGDYAAVIVASTTPGTSSFSSNVIRAGTNGSLPSRPEEIITDEIQRLADVEFTLLEGAKGVVAAAAPAAAQESSGGGGGCTALPGQTDASLLAVVLGAAGFAAWRRRKQG